MFLYPKGHPIYDGHLAPLDEPTRAALQTRIAEILDEPKYRRMADLAGL